MRLLIAADIFPPQAGGPATYCVTLANELIMRGDEVKIVSLNPDGDHVTHNTYHVSRRNKFLKYLQYIYLLWKHGKNTDVIYAMGPVNAGLPALTVAKLRRKKFVVKVVGDYAWEQWQNSKSRTQKAKFVSVDEFQNMKVGGKIDLLKKIERRVVQKADKVIVPSKYLSGIVKDWGVTENEIKVIYNEVEYISADPIKHDGEKWLVSVGRLMSWKGMDTLIEVISDISKQSPESMWKLKIIGDGPEMNNLRKKVMDDNLADIVQLTGNLSNKGALAYMASADVFILNSAYEGFSHVLIEAHNQGVPVLASRAGGNSEVVSSPALFEYNNKKEIEEKVLLSSTLGKRESIRHSFGNDMINDTKETLEKICKS